MPPLSSPASDRRELCNPAMVRVERFLDCFAALAMTVGRGGPGEIALTLPPLRGGSLPPPLARERGFRGWLL
jgi:hypothetical protein